MRKRQGRLLVRYDYQHADSEVCVSVHNDGSQPVEWFTIEVTAPSGTFHIGHVSSVAGLRTSGLGGSYTTISGRNLLPGETGGVILCPVGGLSISLQPPIVRTNAAFAFLGEVHITVGPEESPVAPD